MAEEETNNQQQLLELHGTLEKKGKLGMWSSRYVSFNASKLSFAVAESKKGPSVFACNLRGVQTGGEGEHTTLTFFGNNDGEHISLRAGTPAIAGQWYEAIYSALEAAGSVKPRNAGLPKKDPRFGVPFLSKIPQEYVTRFTKLEHAVLYWFQPVKSYLLTSMLSKKPSLEDRISFVSDRALYVTQLDSSVTHCIKIENIQRIFTNVQLTKDGPHFVVIKLPEQDIHLQAAHIGRLINALNAIYNYRHEGVKELDIRPSEDALDGAVKLNVGNEVKMSMIIPTPKPSLKKALDEFAQKHGITFEETPSPSPDRTKKKSDSEKKAKEADTKSAGPKGRPVGSAALPKTDPMACFLIAIGYPEYYTALRDGGIDIDLLEMMDEDDLSNFGMKDRYLREKVRLLIEDPEIMEDARAEAEAAQKGEKWDRPARAQLPKSTGGEVEPVTSGTDFISSTSANQDLTSPTGARSPIQLLDSDLDDSDDDLLLPPAKKPSIMLDSDDDLDLAATASFIKNKQPIILDDDDDI